MSEQDDERRIEGRLANNQAGFDEDIRAAIARGYERGKAKRAAERERIRATWDADVAELCADRDRLTSQLANERTKSHDLTTQVTMLRERLAATQVDVPSRLAALEQRVGELVEITRGCVDESIEDQDALARLAALRAPGMGSDVDVQRDRADRLAVLVDGLRGTLERTRAEIETLRAKLAEAERCAQESADIMRRARDRAESYCLRLGEAESQRDALRAHALKLDGLCERAAVLLGALGRDDHQLVRAIRSRGEVPR